MPRGSLWLLIALLLATASPAAAEESFIVYACGDGYANLCRIQPDGSGPRTLTSDGQRGGSVYTAPSLSRDGTRLAFNFANKTYVTDGDPMRRGEAVAQNATLVALRPDGNWLATTETFPEQTMVPGPTGPTFFSTFTPFIITYNLTTAQRSMTRRLPGTLAWSGERIVSSGQATPTKRQTLCLLKPDNVTCERQLAEDTSRDLLDPAVSPDASLLAVAACAQPKRAACNLALYGMATGARLRDTTAGPDDTLPAWSPDGASLVFTRGGDLFVVAADGAPGSERLLVRGGRQPTWGGSATRPAAPVPPAPSEPAPPQPAPPGPTDPGPAAPESNAVQLAVATAADLLQVGPEQVVVVSVEPMDWADSALGCPEPGRAYAQVISPGYLVVVSTVDDPAELQIHTDAGQRAVTC